MIDTATLTRRRAQWWDRHLLPATLSTSVDQWWAAASATDPRARDILARMRALEAQVAGHPLAMARLWEPECRRCLVPAKGAEWRGVTLEHVGPGWLHRCSRCGVTELRTSQRAAVRQILAGGTVDAFLMGGNRSGKTKAGAQLVAAFAYGSASPIVQVWAQHNRLPLHRIQPGPGRVWSVSLTWSDSLEYLRPSIDLYIPGPTVARRVRWKQNQQAEIILPNGGVIVSKCVEQGRGGFQGSAIHLLHFDEEPLDDDVTEEAGMRCVDHTAPTLNTMTSLSGWTGYLTKFLGYRNTGEAAPPGVVDVEIHGEDNPWVDSRMLERKAVGARAASRLKGAIVDPTGRVHPDFLRAAHVVPAFTPPADWPRFTVIDFGFRDPFVCLWGALGPDDTLHIYREHYEAERTTAHHARAIHDAELCPACWPRAHDIRAAVGSPEWWQWRILGDQHAREIIHARTDPRLAARRLATAAERCCACDGTGRAEPEPALRLADPADAQAIASLATQYGLSCHPAVKSRQDSYDALCRRLAVDGNGRPHLIIHDCCASVVRELELLRWGKATAHQEVVVVGDDHAWDCLRYLSLGLELHGYSRAGGL
jgi:hypothetical protein